jgi:hypothetical protein
MPWGLAVGADGSVVVSDFGAQTVRRISPAGVISTVLGAPPQPTARRSLAADAHVPPRRRVAFWLARGAAGVSDESASGRRAVIRTRGGDGGPIDVTVVRGPSTFTWSSGDSWGCWNVAATAVGRTGDPVQARDLQAATRAPAPLAPGAGPWAPDLVRGDLVLARALVAVDDRPQFGVPAWYTHRDALRIVEWLIHRPSGRVVAVQSWWPYGLERRWRIAPAHGALVVPPTRPRLHLVVSTPQFSESRCGPRGNAVRFAFGYRDGVALARRVTRRLERTPALRVRADGRSAVGRRFTVRALLTLDDARVREEVRRVATGGAGGPACRVRPSPDPFSESAPERARVLPWEDAFFEQPRRRGRLLVLRAYVGGLTVDSLIDRADMRLVGQDWWGVFGGRGHLRFSELATAPPFPPPEPRCLEGPAA